MKTSSLSKLALALLAVVPLPVLAFNSGSTGADGAFNPTVNTQLQLPDSGVFNFTSVSIPAGVTVTFKKNVTNTPVVILATGDVTIAGTIDVSGGNAAAAGAAGDGNLGDDGVPGTGGPGGYDGGRGGPPNYGRGGAGIGPGAGQPGIGCSTPTPNFPVVVSGTGAGFGAAAIAVSNNPPFTCAGAPVAYPVGGVSYGSSQNLPLVGGSGGGGASGGPGFAGAGGGGGGGAILIAASGTVSINGSILANGGKGGDTSGASQGGEGGGGSGGAIRVIATSIAGNGTVSASGGAVGRSTNSSASPAIIWDGTAGAVGRIRLESEIFTRTAATTPAYTFSAPGAVFVTGLPALRMSRVAGVDVPLAPTGNGDVVLPASTTNPITVEFATTGVPVGNTVKLTVTPASGPAITAVSVALTGTTQSATASTSVTLPSGPSILSAQITYTIVASLGDALSRYANNERVEKVRLEAAIGGVSTVTLITATGKEYRVPPAVLAGVGG